MELIDKKKFLNTTRIYRDDPQDVIYRKYAVRQLIKSRPVVNAIPIPEGATNGDIIKTMFPNAKIEHGLYGITGIPLICLNLGTRYDVHEMSFVEEWWSAPYKGVQNEIN